MPSPDTTQSVTIPSGSAVSGPAYLGHGELCALTYPTSWTTADLTLQTSLDGVTYQDAYNEAGTEITIKAGAARNVALIVPIRGALWLKLRSGSSGSPTNQGADRIIGLLVRKLAVPGIGR